MKRVLLIVVSSLFALSGYGNVSARDVPQKPLAEPVFPHEWVSNVVVPISLAAPVPAYIYDEEYVAFSATFNFEYAGYCNSRTDPARGACPVGPEPGNPTPVMMAFTERRTHITTVLRIDATRSITGFTGSVFQGIADDASVDIPFNTTRFTAVISPEELKKLPFGGIWDGVLDLDVRFLKSVGGALEPPAASVAWTRSVELRVTDPANIQVYLPDFGSAEASVDLNLSSSQRAAGPGSLLRGERIVDACLYDGFNSYSDRIEIRVDDTSGAVPDATGLFYVHRDGASSWAADETIPFTVSASDPSTGAPVSFISGEPLVTQAARPETLRPVHIPGVPGSVVCAPWPITLTTPPIDSSTKQSGSYSGQLVITFIPSTTQP